MTGTSMDNRNFEFFAISRRENRYMDEQIRLVLQIDIVEKRFDGRQ